MSKSNGKRRGRPPRAEAAKKAADQARELKEALEESCRGDIDDDLAALQRIIEGGPAARNAGSRVKAIALKWSYGFGAPKQPISLDDGNGGSLVVRLVRGRKS